MPFSHLLRNSRVVVRRQPALRGRDVATDAAAARRRREPAQAVSQQFAHVAFPGAHTTFLTKRHSFLSALPMFVPSLSCKMMHLYTNGAKKVAFLYRDLTVEVPVRAYALMQKYGPVGLNSL
eukprot:COSAG06_NODE_1044_length_10979_cov_10.105331_6_plen_122_part_00